MAGPLSSKPRSALPDLEYVKQAVAAGKMPEKPWELFLHIHFRGLTETQAQRQLETWAKANDIEVTLFDRDVNKGKVTYVMFSER